MYINKSTFLTLFQKKSNIFFQKSKSFKLDFCFFSRLRVKLKLKLRWWPFGDPYSRKVPSLELCGRRRTQDTFSFAWQVQYFVHVAKMLQARVELRGAAGGFLFAGAKFKVVNLDDRNARFVRLSTFLDLVLGVHCAWQAQYFGCSKLTFCFRCNIWEISTKDWLKSSKHMSLDMFNFHFSWCVQKLGKIHQEIAQPSRPFVSLGWSLCACWIPVVVACIGGASMKAFGTCSGEAIVKRSCKIR